MQNLRGNFGWALVIVFVTLFVGGVSYAQATSIDDLRSYIDQRRAERRAEIEQRLDDLRGDDSSDEDTDEQPKEDNETVCECSANVGLNRPLVRWKNGTLEIVPQFDLSIRIKDNPERDPWNLALAYEGTANGAAFSGGQQFGGQCFSGRYKYTGISGQPISLSSILQNSFGSGVEGFSFPIVLKATLSGCDTDSEHKQATIDIEEFGNIDINSWRTAR